MQTETETMDTWDALRELGFQLGEYEEHYMDKPELFFDFGNCKLFASFFKQKREGYVLFVAVFDWPVADARFRMPKRVKSSQQCAAGIAWGLDNLLKDEGFIPQNNVAWLETGRKQKHLLAGIMHLSK